MSTSGVTTWQLTSDEIVTAALRKIAVISSGVAASTTQKSDATQALNAMLKSFQAKGMPLWAIKDFSFALTATRTYTIGTGQTVSTPAPLKIIQAYNKDTTAITSTPMNVKTRYDYNLNQPTSTSTGTPVDLEYEPGLQVGTMHIWPLPDAYSIANRQITIIYQRPFEDMVNTTDNLDFPQYWHEAVIYGLAWRLAPEYGIPIQDLSKLEGTARYHLEEALSFGTEEGSLFLQPDWR